MTRRIDGVLQIPDLHCPFADLVALNAIYKFARAKKPKVILLMGDALNLSGISRHVQEDLIEQYEGKVIHGLVQLGGIVEELFRCCPQSKMKWIWGNHDEWLVRFCHKFPAWEKILDDPIGLLENYGPCKHARRVELIQFEDPDEDFAIGRMSFVHGFYTGKYAATQHLEAFGVQSVTCGHSHTMQMFTATRRGAPVAGYVIGHLMSKAGRRYLKGRPTRWVTGFAYMEHEPETGIFTQHLLPIVEGKFIFDGRIYDGNWKDGERVKNDAVGNGAVDGGHGANGLCPNQERCE